MKKRLLMLLVVLCAAVCFATRVGAAEIAGSGYCGGEGDGTNLTWTLDRGGTLTIRGVGEMKDFPEHYNEYWHRSYYNMPWYRYNSDRNHMETVGFTDVYQAIYDVIIDEGVTKLGDNFFYSCYSSLHSIVIPDSLTDFGLGEYGLNSCNRSLDIVVSESAEKYYLSDGILYRRDGNENVCMYYPKTSNGLYEIPSNITRIGKAAFLNNETVTTVLFHDGLTAIDDYAFSGCSNLNNIVIPSGVTSIGNYAFSDCSKLTSVTIPDSVIFIGDNAFYRCTGLTGVILPDRLTSTGNNVFSGCSGLTSVTIPDSISSIGSGAFLGCSGLTSISIPNSVTSIGDNAFSGCSGLTIVTIPDSISSIGSGVFSRCSGLTGISIPSNVTSIGDYAFSRCSGLTDISIPDGVTSIGKSAFSGCSGLASISIPNRVTSIEENTFSDCSGLTDISIPDGVTSIGMSAFLKCTGLINVVLPNSVISIGNNAFSDCSGLTDISIPDGVTSIGKSAFSGCSGLTSITIPNSVTHINYGVFSGCSGLTSVTIPNSVTSIGSEAFHACSRLTSVTIPNSVTSIGSAFSSCSGLTSVKIPNSVTYIGEFAFSNCSNLISIIIPNSVTSIEKHAFYCCTGLTSVTIPNSVTSVRDGAFSSCSGLTSVKIPNSVTYIGEFAFSNCSNLISIIIPNSVTSIGAYAFEHCNGLISVTIPNSVTSIGRHVLSGCDSLHDVYYTGTEEQWNQIKGNNNLPSSAVIHYNASPASEQNKPKLYAMILNGAHGDKELGSDNDCALMYNLLTNNESEDYSVEKKNIHSFWYNNETTPIDDANIVNKWMSTSFDNASKDDIIVFYYSGHAAVEGTSGLGLSLSAPNNCYYSWLKLVIALRDFQSNRIIIILDMCSSEKIISAIKNAIENGIIGENDADRFTVISACAEDEGSDYKKFFSFTPPFEIHYGRFTYWLGHGAGFVDDTLYADTNESPDSIDGKITIRELYKYVSKSIKTENDKHPFTKRMTVKVYPENLNDPRLNFPLFVFRTSNESAESSLTSAASSTTENVNAAVDTLKGSNKTQLANAIQVSPDAQNNLSRVENTYSAANHITVSAPVSNVSEIASSAVRIVGAALNGQTGDTLSFSVDTTAQSPAYDPAAYQNPTWFDMTLTASNGGENRDLKDLDIPVSVTLPIPQGRDASKQYVLHYREDGGVDELTPEIDAAARTARIVISGFSTFAFVEKANEDESAVITVSLNPNGGTAEYLRIPAYVGQEYGALPVPVQPGYRFMGWYTGLESGVKVDAATVVAARNDHTLYARWSAVSLCDLTVADDGATSVNVEPGGADAFLYVATYNSVGQFLDVTIREIGSSGTHTLQVDRSNAKSVSAYLFDSELRPLCASEKVNIA